jgi:hypothetical protein
LLNADYNNAWTPDVFWRLALYFHGAFIPWMMAPKIVLSPFS